MVLLLFKNFSSLVPRPPRPYGRQAIRQTSLLAPNLSVATEHLLCEVTYAKLSDYLASLKRFPLPEPLSQVTAPPSASSATYSLWLARAPGRSGTLDSVFHEAPASLPASVPVWVTCLFASSYPPCSLRPGPALMLLPLTRTLGPLFKLARPHFSDLTIYAFPKGS